MLTFAVKKKRTSIIAPKRHTPIVKPLSHSLHLQQVKVRHILRSPILQPKLTIGQPDDMYEQEADRVAEQVMRMPEPGPQRQIGPEDEEKLIQMSQAGGVKATIDPDVEARIQSLRGRGKPLSEPERAFFEPRFGYDFTRVRIHTDALAAKMARAVNARAFTVGRNVVFGEGQHSPKTAEGKKLIGHELAHVMQQRKSSLNTRFIQFQQEHQQQHTAQNVQQ